MAKGSEQELRKQIEILKAQIKATNQNTRSSVSYHTSTPQASTSPKTQPAGQQNQPTTHSLDYAKIKSDLKKTLIFSVVMTLALFGLFFTEQAWMPLLKFI